MTLVNTREAGQKVLTRLNDLKAGQSFVYDVETSGLDWRHNHAVGHVLTFGPRPQDTFYVPVRHAGGGNLPGCSIPTESDNWSGDTHPFEDALIKILNRPDAPTMVGHGLSFDLSFLHKLGFKGYVKCRDTMILAYLKNELRRSFSLDAVCRDERVTPKKGDELYARLAELFGGEPTRYAQMGNYWRIPATEKAAWDYAAGDGTSTFEVDIPLYAAMFEGDVNGRTLEQAFNVEMNLVPVLHRMRMRGIKVNEDRLQEILEITQREFDEGTKAIGGINVRSPIAMKKYFENAGVTNWPLTPKGKPSFLEWWLKTSEAGQKILYPRKRKTMIENSIIPTLERHLYKGRVHPEFHQTRDEEFGTKTGRLSCTAPNLFAAPGKRQADLGARWRSAFEPDHGEWKEGDHDACEIRVGAHYTGAKVWMDGFTADPPVDPHTAVATTLDMERTPAKIINLGIMMGMGISGLTHQLGGDETRAHAFLKQYFDGLPELKRFRDKARRVFASRGYVTTLAGRRVHLEERRKAYTAVNRLTQGGNADIIKQNMVEADAICEAHGEATINLSVYDSLSWQSSDDKLDADIMHAMKHPAGIEMRCPLSVSVGHGANWAKATFFEED